MLGIPFAPDKVRKVLLFQDLYNMSLGRVETGDVQFSGLCAYALNNSLGDLRAEGDRIRAVWSNVSLVNLQGILESEEHVNIKLRDNQELTTLDWLILEDVSASRPESKLSVEPDLPESSVGSTWSIEVGPKSWGSRRDGVVFCFWIGLGNVLKPFKF